MKLINNQGGRINLLLAVRQLHNIKSNLKTAKVQIET
jgi:hypothetical protein